jgi:hypothetical protein
MIGRLADRAWASDLGGVRAPLEPALQKGIATSELSSFQLHGQNPILCPGIEGAPMLWYKSMQPTRQSCERGEFHLESGV